jgi:hypothetical protein
MRFIGSLDDEVRNDTVESDRGKNEGQNRKSSEEAGDQPSYCPFWLVPDPFSRSAIMLKVCWSGLTAAICLRMLFRMDSGAMRLRTGISALIHNCVLYGTKTAGRTGRARSLFRRSAMTPILAVRWNATHDRMRSLLRPVSSDGSGCLTRFTCSRSLLVAEYFRLRDIPGVREAPVRRSSISQK